MYLKSLKKSVFGTELKVGTLLHRISDNMFKNNVLLAAEQLSVTSLLIVDQLFQFKCGVCIPVVTELL